MSLLLSNRAIIKYADNPVMEFQTNKSGTFNPSFTINAGNLIWDFGDGSILYEGNTPSHTYADSSTKTVKVYQNTVTEISVISAVQFQSQNIIGILDYSWHIISGGWIFINSNPGLTGLLFTSSGNTCTDFRAHSCGIIGVPDLSGITFSTGGVSLNSNPLLTNVIFSSSGNTSNGIQIQNCGLNSNVDISGVVVNGAINLSYNTLLSGVKIADGSILSYLDISYSGFNSELDLSLVTITSIVYINSCASLSDVTLGAVTNTLYTFYANLDGLTTASVDGILAALNAAYTANPPVVYLNLFLQGGTNGVPTGGLSNADLLNILAIYTGEGLLATILINT